MVAVKSPPLDQTLLNASSQWILNIPSIPKQEQYRIDILVSAMLAAEAAVLPMAQIIKARDFSAFSSLDIDNLDQIEKGVSFTESISSISLIDDLLFDEPLPRIPRSVQIVHGKLRLVQRRKPNLLMDTVRGMFEDNG